jgi:hypothetical protein
MILTHCGKFGDFIPSLVIPNYYYKNNNEKTTFVLSSWFKSIKGLEEFLLLQDFTEKVIFDEFLPNDFSLGAQPYKFKPEVVTDEVYYNLGLAGFPNKYLGVMYAEEYDLKYDLDIKLNFIDENFPEEYRNKKMYTHFYDERWDKDRYDVRFTEMLPNDGYEPFDPDKSLLHNLNLAYYSSSSIYYPNGFSVISDLCDIKYELVNGSVNPSVYYLNHL